MKKIIILTTLISLAAASAHADQYIRVNKGIQGLLLGAGGGALAGQAIGRNTESTLIGTTLGTLIGYMVGNEMDKNSIQNLNVGYPHSPNPLYQGQPSNYRYNYRPAPTYRLSSDHCKEVEILGTVQGAPQRIITSACPTPDGWILVDSPPASPAQYRYEEPGYHHPTTNQGYQPDYHYHHQRVNHRYR